MSDSARPTGRLVPGSSVTVQVPATSANLGPGFDCLGLALDWRESIRVDVIEAGYRVDVTGEGADRLPRDESHLVLRSVLVGLTDLGVTAPGLAVSGHNTIPHGRGLGSSSAAIVAGLLAAATLAGEEPGRDWLLRHADAVEGHPDNVAAAIHGGFVLAWAGEHGVRVASAPVADGLRAVLLIPASPVATSAARGLLPVRVPHVDAAANAGRAALLVHALAREPALLLEATRDWLHQDYRRSAMPASYELVQELRADGHAAVVSGAGPTVLVLGTEQATREVSSREVPGFRTVNTTVGTGATAGRTARGDSGSGTGATLGIAEQAGASTALP